MNQQYVFDVMDGVWDEHYKKCALLEVAFMDTMKAGFKALMDQLEDEFWEINCVTSRLG